MNTQTSDRGITALLVVDPYNDFISEGGKIWPRIKAVAEANNCVPNMLQVLNVARNAKLKIFFAMHHRYRLGRLRDLEVHCAHSEGGVDAKNIRVRHVGW